MFLLFEQGSNHFLLVYPNKYALIYLYLDDKHLDQNADAFVNPQKVFLSKYDVSDDIKSIEVFASGFLKLKYLSW